MSANRTSRRTTAELFTRGLLWTVFWLSASSAVLGLLLGGIRTVFELAEGTTTTELVVSGALPAAADRGDATLESGAYETAIVEVSDLSAGTDALVALARAATVLTGTAVAVSIAVLCWSLLRQRTFGPGLSRTVTVGGAVVLITGILGIGLGTLGSWMVADELNGGGSDGFWPIRAAVDGSPIWIGVVMMLIGLAFEYGERLQRDTAGLV